MGNTPAKVQQETWRDMGRDRMGASRLVCSRSRTRVIVGLDAMQTQEGEDGRWSADILGLDMLVEGGLRVLKRRICSSAPVP